MLNFGDIVCYPIISRNQHGEKYAHICYGKYVVTGRNMDWFQPFDISLWVQQPRGLHRDGGVEKNSLTWTSQYGSVALTSHDKGKVEGDGLNEKGLSVNRFYLTEKDFSPRDIKRPGLSWAGYVQYLLDNFATVSQAVSAMRNSPIQVVAYPPIPGAKYKPPTMHFSLSDASGDSAIFEYLNGKLVIHHGQQHKVMTNSPIYA